MPRILHLSDTHMLHRTIEDQHRMPAADILVHTGDFTNRGEVAEFLDFNEWLGEIGSRYEHRVVILGNHEHRNEQMAVRLLDGGFAASLLSNATHVLHHNVVDIMGLRVFGTSWCGWHTADRPGDVAPVAEGPLGVLFNEWQSRSPQSGLHRFDEIPPNIDILLSHGPAYGIFDNMEGIRGAHWGGSRALRGAIERARPTVHLFGHLHEQRGVFVKQEDGSYSGNVEYEVVASPGQQWTTFPPPPPSYPCALISCNAMKSHPGIDGLEAHIAGPARLILAENQGASQPKNPCLWSFRLG